LAYASGGGFDYAALADSRGVHADSGSRRALIAIAWPHTAPPQGSDSARAFWIDVYNGSAIIGVLNHYPIASVMNVDGYFTEPHYELFGERLSLDDIEKRKVLPAGGDPRLHFAIVCASAGCPALHSHPFADASDLDALLDSLTRRTVNDTLHVQLDFERSTATLSRLFDWYAEDFSGAAGSVIEFIASYHERGAQMLDSDWEIHYREYDWSLNQRSP
jgi:hypothetical protein